MRVRGLLPLLLLLALRPPHGLAEEARSLTVYYTASLNGNLDGCHCLAQPRAGLVKRAAWLAGLSREERERSILVDAGDLMDPGPDEPLSGEIAAVYRELGYDAVAVGEGDLADGLEALLARRDRLPLLANNLSVCPDDSRCVFFSPDPVRVVRGGVRVGLLGLVDPQVFALQPEPVRARLKAVPPEVLAQQLAARLRAEGTELVVLLYHGPLERAEALARRVSGIDVLIVGHEQRLAAPRRVGKTLLASPGEEGNRVGVLRLTLAGGRVRSWSGDFRLLRFDSDPDDPGVRGRIVRYRREMRARLGGTAPGPDPGARD